MSKRAVAAVEEQDMKTSTLAAKEAMAKRKTLAGHIRDRMAKPATAVEQKLWQELKAEVEKEALQTSGGGLRLAFLPGSDA